MTDAKPTDKIVPWEHDDFSRRINACRAMLLLHGFLSEKENEKVRKRIIKWLDKNSEVARFGM